MRLSPKQISAIVESIENHLSLSTAKTQIHLFGSRTKQSSKGGDIDLLILLDEPVDVSKWRSKKSDILRDMKQKMGDQRIDLKISARIDLETDPFLNSILDSMVSLKEWPGSSS